MSMEKDFQKLVDGADKTLGDLGVLGEKKEPKTIFGPDLSPKEHGEMAMKENIYCLGYKHAYDKFSKIPLKEILSKIEWDGGKMKDILWKLFPDSYGDDGQFQIRDSKKCFIDGNDLASALISELPNMVKRGE